MCFFVVVVVVVFIFYVHIARWESLIAELICNGKILLLNTAAVLNIPFFLLQASRE